VREEPPATAEPTPASRRRRRWPRRVLVGLLLFVVVLLVVLHLPPVQQRLVTMGLRGLAARQQLDVEWRDVDFNLITGRVTLEGLRLGQRGAATPLVAADRVHVSYPYSLYRGRLDGMDVTLENAVVTLTRDDGRWTTIPAAWLRRTPGGKPRRLPAFAALRLHNLSVIYEDINARFRSETTALSVDLLPTGSSVPGDLAGDLTPGASTVVRWEPRGTRLTLRGGRAFFSPDATGVQQLQLDAPEGRVQSDVRFAFQGTDRFGLTARADLEADQLAGWVAALQTARGRMQVDITMPATRETRAFADIGVHSPRIVWRDLVFTDLAAAGALATNAVTLTDATVGAGGGRIAGNAHLGWTAGAPSRASLRGQHIDVAAILRTLVPDSPAVARFTPGSLATGTFSGSWTGWDSNTLDGVLESTWRPRPRGLDGRERYAMTGSVRTRFAGGPWIIDIDTRVDDALDVDGQLTLSSGPGAFADWPMTGALTLSGATAPTLLTALRLFDIDPPVDLSDASGTLEGPVTMSGALGSPVARVELGGDLAWPDQPPIDARVVATITTDEVEVPTFVATSGPSRAEAALTIDLTRDTIDGNFTGFSVPVESWLRRFDIRQPITGVADVEGTLSGPLSAIRIDATTTGQGLDIAGQRFDRFNGAVVYDGRTVSGTDLVLTRGAGDVKGRLAWTRGVGALDGEFEVRGLPFETRIPGITGVSGEAAGLLSAAVGGRLAISGTAETPVLDLAVDAPEVTLDRHRFGRVALTARPGAAGSSRVALDAPDLGVRVEGTVALGEPRVFDLTAHVDAADSPLALDVKGVAVELGATTLTARATGRLDDRSVDLIELAISRLEGAVVEITEDEAGLAVGLETDVAASSDGRPPLLPFSIEPGTALRYRPDHVIVERAAVITGQTRITASGSLGTPDDTLVVTAVGRMEDFVPLSRALAPATAANLVLEGPVRLNAVASGALSRAQVRGALEVDDARVGDGVRPAFESVWLRVVLDGEQIRLDLIEGHWQGAHVAMSGAIPTWFANLPGSARTSARATLTGHVDDVTLKVLEPFVPPDSLRATTFESRMTFEMAATEPSLDALTGTASIERAVLRSRELGLAQRGPARFRLERGVVTLEPWTLGAPWSLRTVVTLGGAVTLPRDEAPALVDVGLEGTVDLRALGLLLGGYRPAGSAALDVQVRGPVDRLAVDGLVRVNDAELLIREPRLVLEEVNGAIRFTGDRVAIESLNGSINGGTLSASGSMRQPGRGTPDGALSVAVRGMLLEIPRGLRSAINADLAFSGRADGRYDLEGTVEVTEAAYRETLLVTGGLMSLIAPRDPGVIAPDPGSGRPTWLVLDIRVRADDSMAFDTTYGRFNAGANIRIQGTPATPRVTGTAAIAPGGELFVGGRRYQIESGVFEFRNPVTLRPDIRFLARTTVAGYDVSLNIESRGGATETTLQSDPPLPEEDIASLLISGQRRGAGDAAEAVTQQLVAALSGEIVGTVGRVIGFDSVRVEQANPGDVLFDPTLLSADTNLAQRLTFSKRVFRDLEVVFSQSLRESGDITWVISWQPISGLELRFVQLDDEDRAYEVRNDLSFGGGVKRSRAARRTREQVRRVQVIAGGAITETQARELLKLDAGDRFDFYDWQGDRDRLQRWLLEHSLYEGRVQARRDPTAAPAFDAPGTSPVDLTYTIETGPRTELVVQGVNVPGDLRDQLVQAWVDVPVDSLLEEEFSVVLRPWLAGQGYLRPEIDLQLAREAGTKRVTIVVTPGERTTTRALVFEGNDALSDDQLAEAVARAGLADHVWVQPADAAAPVLAAYRREGYLTATATVLEVRFDGSRAELPIRISEGPRFTVASVAVDGVGEVEGVDIKPPIDVDGPVTDRLVADTVREFERRFRRAGYRGTRVTAESTTGPDGRTDLVFTVLLGQRARLQDVRIAGASDTGRRLIERALDFDPGDPLSTDRLNRTRDRLYDSGLFRTVTLETTPVETAEGRPNPGALVANVTVEELPRYRLRYGFQLYDPSSPLFTPKWGTVDPGVVADLTRRGIFGRGITAGVGARVNPSEQTVRGYLSSRSFFAIPAQTNLFVGREDQRFASGGFVLDSLTRSVTFDQRLRYRRLLQVSYGYSFEKRTFDFLVNVPPLPVPVPVEVRATISRLLGSLVFDERDDVVNTRQGPFHSSSVEWAPESLGTTRAFKKYLGQQFYFVPWGPVTFGAAARLEVAGGPGRGLITTERLRVGGAYTVRGYDDDTLSLQDITGATPGSTSIVVVNQETRFPLTRRLQGAAFWDYAHIYGETGEFSGLRVRNSVGAGVRLLLPFIIVRVDYGYPINQDTGNDKGRWYFAIGQAF
jgi:outer membrane protein assembly factor BamA/autotransporter translocation and assembly factor TamB